MGTKFGLILPCLVKSHAKFRGEAQTFRIQRSANLHILEYSSLDHQKAEQVSHPSMLPVLSGIDNPLFNPPYFNPFAASMSLRSKSCAVMSYCNEIDQS